jgi:hypothetical protein
LQTSAGGSAALLFPDAAVAGHALDVLVAHLETHTGGIFGLGVQLDRTRDLDAELGDEAEAFVLDAFVFAREGAQVVVVVWRTDNLVQLVWDIQLRGTSGGVDAVIDAAESIESRVTGERQVGGEGD